MASDLSALIARLREAREGSRELDCDIYEAIDSNFPKGAVTRIEIAPGQPIFATGGYTYAHAPHYTTDLTAAVALCERLFGTARMKEIFKGALEAWNPADGVKAFVLQFVIAILTAKDQSP